MPPAEVTELLHRVASGDKTAEADLVPRIYEELRRIAQIYLRRERPGHTLQATALVHEAYLKLMQQQEIDWKDRSHFFAVAAQVMRRILVDYARQKGAAKRGGNAPRILLNEEIAVTDDQCALVTGIDEALNRLQRVNPRQASIVELRFFSGLSMEEIATVLGLASRTVKRDWMLARAWLYGELSR